MGLLFLPLLFLQDIKYPSVEFCPFDLKRDAHYAVTVRNGKIYRHALSYVSMPREDSLIPCLAHQV